MRRRPVPSLPMGPTAFPDPLPAPGGRAVASLSKLPSMPRLSVVQPRAHRLRVREGAVVESPVPVLHRDAEVWAATCRRDDRETDGVRRIAWWPSPYHRGHVPVALGFADVIEFAADVPVRRLWLTTWQPVRWHGLAVADAPDWLVLYGPYPTLGDALAASERIRGMLALGTG